MARLTATHGVSGSTKALSALMFFLSSVPAFAQGGGDPFGNFANKVSTLVTSNGVKLLGVAIILMGVWIALKAEGNIARGIMTVLIGGVLVVGYQNVISWIS